MLTSLCQADCISSVLPGTVWRYPFPRGSFNASFADLTIFWPHHSFPRNLLIKNERGTKKKRREILVGCRRITSSNRCQSFIWSQLTEDGTACSGFWSFIWNWCIDSSDWRQRRETGIECWLKAVGWVLSCAAGAKVQQSHGDWLEEERSWLGPFLLPFQRMSQPHGIC